MQVGISTASFYPQYPEVTLAQLCKHNVKSSEVFLNCFSELKIPYLKQLRGIADDGGLSIPSVHPFTSGMESLLFFTPYPRRFEDGRELYKRYFQAANILGADIVVFHGNFKTAYNLPITEYYDCYAQLVEDASQFGVQLCHENVAYCVSNNAQFFAGLAGHIPNAGFVFDVKQAVRAGQDVYDFAQTMGKNIRHIHISDHSSKGNCLVPGCGVLNIPKLLEIVGKNGFNGTLMVELYRENFATIVEILQGYQHLSHIISTLA